MPGLNDHDFVSPDHDVVGPELFDHEDSRARLPILLLIDKSVSMKNGYRIARVNNAMEKFAKDLTQDPTLSAIVEICVVTFGNNVNIIQSWVPVSQWHPTKIKVDRLYPRQLGHTRGGTGMRRAVEIIQGRKKFYHHNGAETPYKPFILILGDGAFNGEDWSTGRDLLKQADIKKELVAFFAAIDGQDVKAIKEIWDLPNRDPRIFSNLTINEILAWVTKSVKQVSSGNVGAPTQLVSPQVLAGTEPDTFDPNATVEI